MSFSIIYKTSDEAQIRSVKDFIADWQSDKLYMETTTSGSTGKPKTIRINKEFMINSAKMTGDYLQLEEGMNAILCLSPQTIAGKMMIVRSIVLGMKLTVVDPVSHPLDKLEKTYDFIAMVPLQAESSLDRLNMVNCIIIGGAPISGDLFKSIAATHPRCFQTFGMTETISHIAMRKITAAFEPYEVLPGVELTVDGDQLVVTATHLGVENLKTNDIVELLDDKHFIWKGRVDFTINSGGYKLQPEEIENKLRSLIPLPYFVYGMDDSRLGQKLVLCLEGSLNLTKESFNEILSKYAIPKEIYFFKKFHYTESGKLDRMRTVEQLEHVEKQVL